MKTKRRLPVLALGGLIGGIGLGLLTAFLLFPPSDASVKSSPQEAIQFPILAGDSDNQDTDSVPSEFFDIIEFENVTEQRIALYQMLENKSEEQIAALLRQSFSLSSPKHLSSIQSLLFAALARLDPEMSIELVWEANRADWDVFFTSVFEEWAGIDPKNALQMGSGFSEPWKSKASRTILQTRSDFTDAERLELAESFGVTTILNEWTFMTQFEEVIDEPGTAFELVLNAHIPNFRKSELVTLITQRWIEREDTDDISSMLSLVHDMFSEEQYQWRLVVSTLAATDPKLVWEQLLTLSLETQKMLNDEVFKVWVKQDPIEAISALNESDHMSTDSWELNSLYAEWASAVWHQFPQRIDLIPVDYRTNSLTRAVRNVVTRIEPSELLKQLEEIQKKGVNTQSTLETYFRGLSRLDPATAVQWASEYLEEGNYVISSLLQDLAVVDATKAMEIALQQPVSSGAEQSVVQALFSQGWLQQGLELLPKVRDGTSASNLYASAGVLMIENGQISEAIALAGKLSEEARPEYFESLARRWVIKDINAFLPVLSEMPSEELRSSVAEVILRMDVYTGNLTDDEIEAIRSFVQMSADE